jgi:hypothetical protein
MIDILLATYNGQAHLAEQIDSLLAQEFVAWRLLARDDGSKDGTVELLEAYAGRLKGRMTLLPNSGGNLGPMGNFLELMRHSDADHIMLCDQDDVWLPGKIGMTLAKMREMESEQGRDKPLLVHTDFRVVDEHLNILAESGWRYQKTDPDRDSLNRLLVQNVATGCTVMINRALRDLALPVPGEALMHDHWLALAAAAFGKIGYLPTPTLLYRQHGGNEVGAQPWGMASILGHLSDLPAVRKVIASNRAQAGAFCQRYQGLLPERERGMLESFVHLPQRGPLQRRIDIFRQGFFYSGAMRNLGWLFLC